ncbi:MAG: hypothetical protein D4R92_00785 [Actinobacteria bacterium]|nr:MAG: hypothetical protein D4R92_00785 [Actinomycetota bacterium]
MLNIDWRKWFDRMQPQTLQIASMLLYLNGFFALISVIDKTDYLGYLRTRYWFGAVLALAVVGFHAFGGLLMANDRKLGYKFGVAAAFSPFVLRYWAFSDLSNMLGGEISLYRKISGGSTTSLIFEIALCALMLHPQSRSHQRIWYR